MVSIDSLCEKIKEYILKNFPYDPEHTTVTPLKKPADLPGQWVKDVRPMFRVRDEKGKLLSVVKTILVSDHDPWKFSDLEKSIEILTELHLTSCQTVSILGSTRAILEDTAVDICVLSPALGKGLHEFFAEVGDAGEQPSLREKALDSLVNAIRSWAKALAELHLVKVAKSQAFSKTEIESDSVTLSRLGSLMEALPHLFPFQKNESIEIIKSLGAQAESGDIYVGITHGDPDPTNTYFDPTGGQWTLVDTDRMARSLDQRGNPVTRIGTEFIHAKLSLIKAGFFMGFSEKELESIGTHFQQQYQEITKACFPTPEQMDYYSVLYWIKKITWISGLEEGLKYTMKEVPKSFELPRKYQNVLIKSLEGILNSSKLR